MNVLEKILEEIKDLKRKQNSSNQDFLTGYISALSTVEGIMCSYMSEHSGDDTEMGGWIPVEERLPEESGIYIVTAHDGCRMRSTYLKYYKKQRRWELVGTRAYWRVFAWMPLPEPYNPKEDN